MSNVGGLVVVMVLLGVSTNLLANFDYQDFSSTSGLNLVGDAVKSGSLVHITPNAMSQVGAMWASTKQAVQNGFTSTFQFRVPGPGSDGFAFVIQNSSATAMGMDGGRIGYDFPNSVAIEFDTYANQEFNDASVEPHVSVQTRGTDTNS